MSQHQNAYIQYFSPKPAVGVDGFSTGAIAKYDYYIILSEGPTWVVLNIHTSEIHGDSV